MKIRFPLSVLTTCVALLSGGCLEHANPFDPDTDGVVLSIAAPKTATVGSKVDVVLTWTPASSFEPHWSYDTPTVLVFTQFHPRTASGSARVSMRAVARGTVTITAGFVENRTVSHTVVVQ